MRKQSFLRWYYADGLREWIAIWGRFIKFIPYYFSITLLLRTLFAPWHKDISPKTWRGFSLTRSAKKFFWNFISRIIGAIVRITVIGFALLVWAIVAVGGFFVLCIYVFAPLIVVLSIALFFGGFEMLSLVLIVITIFIVLFAYRIYKISGHIPYREMDIVQLNEQKWFYRVYERIGVVMSEVPKEVLKDYDMFVNFLTQQNVTVEEFEQIVAWEIEKQKEREESKRFFSPNAFLKKRPIGLNWHFGYTINLDKYADDITRFDTSEYVYAPFSGFDKEIQLMEVTLSRPQENSLILTGQPGIGKHMMVHELARRIRSGYYKGTFMQHMRVLQCDLAGIMSMVRSEGGDQENMIRSLFYEAAFAGNVILVIDNLEKYMNTQQHHGFSFSAIIDEYASSPSFRMIGIATDEAFQEYINNDRMFMKHFDVIPVSEMNKHHAMRVLFMRFYGKEHTPFTFQALRRILEDSEKYMNTAPLPTRAIDLAMEVQVNWNKHGVGFITEQTVDEFVYQKTGIPVGNIEQEESEQLMSLEDTFHERIIGQDHAVRTVAAAVRRMRSGMSRPNKPSGSFLFLGPTGVGKTETAKVLAEQYYGSQDKIIRLDMSEFQGDSALDKMIGSRELGKQGILTSAAKEQPYAVLLLDEIEKANPRVLDIFLQILDEGFVHDAFGRKINFTTMIIIATSNASAIVIKKMIESGLTDEDVMKRKVVDDIINNGTFRPEFLNRFDDVVIFHPLSGEQVHEVTRVLLEQFSKRMEQEQYVTVVFDDDVVDAVVERGFDSVFGARSLIHYIDDSIADALAKKLIMGDVKRGSVVHFSVNDMNL